MIELRDTVTIDAPPEAVWRWLEALPEHALEWHPDHRGARWLRGHAFTPGAEMEVRELLHGKPHRLRMRVTEVDPGHWVRYRVAPGVGGELAVRPVAGGAEFTAVIRMGAATRGVGPVLDRLLRRVLGDRIEAIARHQAEEGVNLKRLLEAPAGPEPRPGARP